MTWLFCQVITDKVERIYSRIRHLGRKGESGKCKRGDWGIWKGISTRHKRSKLVRKRKQSIWERRIARKIYSKEVIWIVR